MPVAQNVDSFDGRALGEVPPRISVAHGSPSPDSIPAAVGRPGAVATADGTANLGTETRTLEAGDNRARTSSLRATRAPVDHYSDSGV